MKRNKIIVIGLMMIASSLQADFFDNVINRVTDKLERKTEEVVEKKVDAMLSDEPQKAEIKNEKQIADVIPSNDKVGKLKELIEMKKNGYITDSEFQKQKALILN